MDDTQKKLLFIQVAAILLKDSPCKSKQLEDFDGDSGDGSFWGNYVMEYEKDDFNCRIYCYPKEGYIEVRVEPDFTYSFEMTDAITGEEVDHDFDPPMLDSLIDSMADYSSRNETTYKFYPEKGEVVKDGQD